MAYVNVAEARRQGYSVSVEDGEIKLTKTGPAESETKGSYIVTKDDGSQVYRKHGTNALGTYVVDRPVVYQPDSSGSYIAQESKLLTTTERTQLNKPEDLQFSPIYFADNTKAIQDPNSPFLKRTERLVERESQLRQKQRETERLWGFDKRPDDSYPEGFMKAIRRTPGNILYGLQITGGRIAWTTEALFSKEGRAELKRGFGRVPGAVVKSYDPRDPEGLLNIGLTAYSVSSVAKSPSNVGAKAYNKHVAKSDIKGGISGYQDTSVYKGSGIFKGSKIKEITVSTDAGKTSHSTISYKGQTYIIQRNPQITQFKILKGDQVVRIGQYKTPGTGLKPGLDQTSTTSQLKGIVQDQSKPYSILDIDTITKGKYSAFNIDANKFKVKSENIGIGSKTTQRTTGVVTDQKTTVVGPRKLVLERTKPKIELNTKGDVLKDFYGIKKVEGGIETTKIIQPRTVLKGTEDTIIKGSYTFKEIPKGWGTKAQTQSPGSLISETSVTKPTVSINPPKSTFKAGSFSFDRSFLTQTQKGGGSIILNPTIGQIDEPIFYYRDLGTPTTIKEVNIQRSTIYGQIDTKSILDTDTTPTVFVGSSSRPREITQPETRTDIFTEQRPIVNPIETTITNQAPAFSITNIQSPRGRSSVPPFVSPQLPRPPVIPKPLIGPGSKTPVSATRGYDVFVRSKGVFNKINVKPLSKSDAINYGAFRVGTTASATFKISQATGSVAQKFQQKGFLEDFYRKDNLFIEKRGRRIKSPGEKREITFKGISALKRRRKK